METLVLFFIPHKTLTLSFTCWGMPPISFCAFINNIMPRSKGVTSLSACVSKNKKKKKYTLSSYYEKKDEQKRFFLKKRKTSNNKRINQNLFSMFLTFISDFVSIKTYLVFGL